MAAVRGRNRGLLLHRLVRERRGYEHQAPDLRRTDRRKLGGNQRAEPVAQEVDLPQAHGVEEIADGCSMLRDTRTRRRRIGIPESRQIGGENRASNAGNREKSLKSPPRVGGVMKAEQGSALLEAAPRRDGVVHVQLAVAALEIAAADPRSGGRGRAGWRRFGHNADGIVPQRQFGFKLFA